MIRLKDILLNRKQKLNEAYAPACAGKMLKITTYKVDSGDTLFDIVKNQMQNVYANTSPGYPKVDPKDMRTPMPGWTKEDMAEMFGGDGTNLNPTNDQVLKLVKHIVQSNKSMKNFLSSIGKPIDGVDATVINNPDLIKTGQSLTLPNDTIGFMCPFK